MSNQVLILDGKKYTEGSFEEGITLGAYLCYRGRVADTRKLFAFSTRELFQRWVAQQGAGADFLTTSKRIDKATREIRGLSEQEKERLAREELPVLRREEQRFLKLLKEKGVRPNDDEAIYKLARRGEIGSARIYDGINYGGDRKWLYGGLYRKFSNFGWNDRAESVRNFAGHYVVLFQHTYFLGRQFWVFPWQSVANLGDFRNRASSAQV